MEKINNSIFEDWKIQDNTKEANIVILVSLLITAFLYFGVAISLLLSWIVAKLLLKYKNFSCSKDKKIFIIVSVVLIVLWTLSLLFCALWFNQLLLVTKSTSVMIPFGLIFALETNEWTAFAGFNILLLLITILLFTFFLVIYTKKISAFLYKKDQNRISEYNKAYLSNNLTKLKATPVLEVIGQKVFGLKSVKNDMEAKQLIDDKARINWNNGVILNDETLISKNVLTRHTLVVGSTGAGKTNTLLNFVKFYIKNNLKCFFIDMKGDETLIDEIGKMCKKEKKKLCCIKLTASIDEIKKSDGLLIEYDPFKNKTADEIISMILSINEYQVNPSQQSDSRYWQELQRDFLIFYVSLWNEILKIDNLTNKWNIARLSDNCSEFKITEFLNVIKKNNSEIFPRLKNDWTIFISNGDKDRLKTIGNTQLWLKRISRSSKSVVSGGKSLKELMIDDSNVILFSAPALNDLASAADLGRLLIDDLKQSAAFNKTLNKIVGIIIDEFNVIANSNNIDLFNKTRSANYCVIPSIQSLGDIGRISEDYKQQILNLCNTLIVQRTPDSSSADELAKTFGTIEKATKTFQTDNQMQIIDDSNDSLADKGTIAITKSFVFHPDEIKVLPLGSAIVKTISDNLMNVIKIPKIIKIDLYTKDN